MMGRKQVSKVEENTVLELAVSRDVANTKITEQIKKGEKILDLKIFDQQGMDTAQKKANKWNDFNYELLKRLFTSEYYSDEYLCCGSVIMTMIGEPSLNENIVTLHDDIEEKNQKLESIVERLELIPEPSIVHQSSESNRQTVAPIDNNKIFIVHGHDNSAKLEVAGFIKELDFEPIILHEKASRNKTIIEKIEAYSDVGFAIVIYTPCDVGKKESDVKLKGRARQNVVFENGFLIGKLGRDKVCQLLKGEVETPNDISGIVYTSMDSGNWKIDLAQELKEAGYPVDMNKLL